MPKLEFRKRAAWFLIIIAILTAALILLPDDKTAKDYFAAQFGMVVSSDGEIQTTAGEKAPMMAATTVGILENLLNVLEIILWMALVVTLVRLVLYLIGMTVYRSSAGGEVSSLLRTVLSVGVYIVSFFIIFQSQFPSVQLAPLFTGSTIIGIVVGLALQDTLGNLFSGLAIQADQPFQIGDVIVVGKLKPGVVEAVSWRGVKIRTFDNSLLVLSNAALGKEPIEVASRVNLAARLVFFTTVYNTSPSNVIQRVREAVRTAENVSQKHRPVVRMRALGTDGIDWEVKYWPEDFSRCNDSDAAIRQRIWYLCQREKIEFAFPTRTLHIEKKADETAPEELANQFAEILNSVSIFDPLSEDEIVRLANSSSTRVYAQGEPIVRMGQEANSMFIIMNGSVRVEIPDGDDTKVVAILAEGDFFGEMSLLTGEPRSANVVAIVESEVLRIDKNGMKRILESNPTLVETISELVEERRQALTRMVEASEEEEDGGDLKQKSALKSIRKFFGLR